MALAMKRAAIISPAWVLACVALLGLLVGIELDVNFFSWSPHWSLQSLACLAGVPVVVAALYFIARSTQDRSALMVAAFASLALLSLALRAVVPEPKGEAGRWLVRTAVSPASYRWGRVLAAGIPFCFWIWALARATRRVKNA